MYFQLEFLKWLSIALIFGTAILGGAYPFFKKLQTGAHFESMTGQALAAGIFLGAGLIHMLGDAAHGFIGLRIDYPYAFLLAGAMFLFLLLLEHLGQEISEHQGEQTSFFAILALIMLSIHSFLEGAALGLTRSISVEMVLLFAILAHKWAASFALAVQINKTNLCFSLGLLLFTFFALMTPIGILLGTFVTYYSSNLILEPIFNSLAAGTFLYLGTLHGLSRALMIKKCCNLRIFSFVIIGFAVMAVVAIWT